MVVIFIYLFYFHGFFLFGVNILVVTLRAVVLLDGNLPTEKSRLWTGVLQKYTQPFTAKERVLGNEGREFLTRLCICPETTDTNLLRGNRNHVNTSGIARVGILHRNGGRTELGKRGSETDVDLTLVWQWLEKRTNQPSRVVTTG